MPFGRDSFALNTNCRYSLGNSVLLSEIRFYLIGIKLRGAASRLVKEIDEKKDNQHREMKKDKTPCFVPSQN